MSTFTRLPSGKVLFENGETYGLSPNLNVLPHPSDERMILLSPHSAGQLTPEEALAVDWEKVTVPAGALSRNDLIEELATNFFFKVTEGLITGKVVNYAALPLPASSYTGEIWYVENPSGGLLTWVGVYKYPKGLYSPNASNIWELIPLNVALSEDTLTLVNITNWPEWYAFAFNLNIGDRMVYNGKIYENLTGVQTTSSPAIDTTNWKVLTHADLGGLNADDHLQYALLAGRAGGQVLNGGINAGDTLRLISTSSATKGKIELGASATSVYDEVNDRIGIGTNAPVSKLDVRGQTEVSELVYNAKIAPAALTANTNDYAPTGLQTNGRVVLSATANIELTGLDSTGIKDGETRILENTNGSVGDIKLKNNSANSLVANRFYLVGDTTMKVYHSVILMYTSNVGTAGGWIILGTKLP